jgi:hypothetical protein
MMPSRAQRPGMKKLKTPNAELILPADKADFKRLDKLVRHGVAAFMESGKALAEIHERKLWRAGGHGTWEAYCREVVGMSKPHAHRLMAASRIALDLVESLPTGNDFPAIIPVSKSQVRPLQRLENPQMRRRAWEKAAGKADGQPTAQDVIEAVVEILEPEQPLESRPTRSQQRTQLFERFKALIKQAEVLGCRGRATAGAGRVAVARRLW